LNSNLISEDAKERVKKYNTLLSPPGAYTSNSKGFNYARERIAEFIQKRDKVPHVDP
jgi:aspartate/methionine/tyrosine aminotransferase